MEHEAGVRDPERGQGLVQRSAQLRRRREEPRVRAGRRLRANPCAKHRPQPARAHLSAEVVAGFRVCEREDDVRDAPEPRIFREDHVPHTQASNLGDAKQAREREQERERTADVATLQLVLREQEKHKWGELRPKLEAARAMRCIGHTVQPDDEDEYTLAISRAIEMLKRPDDGKMKGIAFIKDPDGYWIEILSPKGISDIVVSD